MKLEPAIPYRRLDRDVPPPTYAHEGDAGMDLCATEDVTLMPGESCMMGSGIAMAIPDGFAGLVVPRSGLGCKGLVLKNGVGVIDAGYRGEIGIPLHNNNPTHILVKEDTAYGYVNQLVPNRTGFIDVHKGDRVAQLLIVPVATADMVECAELPDSERGDAGFGSTDVRERT